MNDQSHIFRKALTGIGDDGEVAVFNDTRGLTGSDELRVDDKGRLLIKGRQAVTEAPQDGRLYGRRNAGWSEVQAVSVIGGGGGGGSSGEGGGEQGPPGPAGPTGPAGPQGEPGVDGADGLDGAPGPQGPQGETGPQGPRGPQGDSGAVIPPATVPPLIDGTAAVGSSIYYAREDHVHPSDVDARGVRFDAAQSLTIAQKTQARSNIYAAPFDALAYNGMQVNGSMEVSQEKGLLGPVNVGYALDGFGVSGVGSMVAVVQQTASSPPPGFLYSLHATITTGQPSLAATDYRTFFTYLEGYRVARLAWGNATAQPLTIAFWVRTSRTGMYSGSVKNQDNTRSYPFPFTMNAANVWEYKTVTIPGDTGGTWAKTNGISIVLSFAIAVGTTYAGPPNVWATANYVGVTGSINGGAATNDIFNITGVVVLPGIEAPSAERSALIMRPYAQELVTCQRYWETGTTWWAGNAPGAGFAVGGFISFTEKRAVPTLTKGAFNSQLNAATNVLDSATMKSARHMFSGVAAGQVIGSEFWFADARL